MSPYDTVQSIDNWVQTIESKFNDIPLLDGYKQIAKILNITDEFEIDKIKKASLIAYANKLGITSFETACLKLSIDPSIPNMFDVPLKYRKKQIAFYKLTIIIDAINNGWTPNWNNTNEYKYYPWFKMNNGFSFYRVYCNNANAFVPSALYLKSNELAMFIGEYFLELYMDYYTN